ncbi:MAG: hypothetical protein ACREIW_14880 [Chthoniobacterales bacterium]
MRRLIVAFFVSASAFSGALRIGAAAPAESESHFVYQEGAGNVTSVPIVRRYWLSRIVHPFAHVDSRLDPRLMRAATIAEERANARSRLRCWHYVKEALLAAGAVNSYPKTAYAIEAGQELTRNYGFRRLPVHDPYAAPVGAVLIYGTREGGGHVEIRTRDGFVSDYHSKDRCAYPLVAVYAKFSS